MHFLVRREIARLTLEKLLQDGRIHPARIEEMYYQTKSELETHIVELGEQGVFDSGVQGVHPELVKLLGRLKFRTSYGQNVLSHSIEVSRLASMMAAGRGSTETSMVKAYACRAAEWVCREAMQIHGGMGYAEEFPVSRYFVDARVLSIFEGADETLCLKVIARRLVEAHREKGACDYIWHLFDKLEDLRPILK